MGTLRAQDVGKGLLIIILILGTVLASFGLVFITHLFGGFLINFSPRIGTNERE